MAIAVCKDEAGKKGWEIVSRHDISTIAWLQVATASGLQRKSPNRPGALADRSAAEVSAGSRLSKISARMRCISASYQRFSVTSSWASAPSRQRRTRRQSLRLRPRPLRDRARAKYYLTPERWRGRVASRRVSSLRHRRTTSPSPEKMPRRITSTPGPID